MNNSPAYRQYLTNKQNAVDAEKLHELQKNNLYNERTFYPVFIKDILTAKNEVIIYCPFITKFRSEFFKGTLRRLKESNVSVFIFTRPLEEHDYLMRSEVSCALNDYEEVGVSVIFLPGNIHAKVAVIDREIFWEGSLNILSQRTSQEIMKRISDKNSAMQIMAYLGLNDKLIESYKLKYERLCKGLKIGVKHNFKLNALIFTAAIVVAVTARWLFVILKAIMLLVKN